MTKVFHRHNKTNYKTAVKGDGVYIIDEDGKRYLDGCCGAAVSCLGHSNEEVRAAMKEQIDKLAFAHSGFFTNEPMEELADWLVERAPEKIGRVYFVSGGSEAVEASMKLARQYFLDKGKSNKRHVIARWQSYHGNTLGALSAGGNKWRRAQFDTMLIESHHISPCYEYRGKKEGESSFDYGQRVAGELEDKINELGADNVMAFFAEPIVGATMGAVPAVDGYFKKVRQICDKHDILLILDEVMCGMGRTGALFACEYDGISPDIVTIAKGLGGGYQPIGAMLCSDEIHDTITKNSGFFQHGHTYLGHATACATALKVQKIIERDNLLQNVRDKGELLKSKLVESLTSHPNIGDIRGRGLFLGVEIVQNKDTKDPFPIEEKVHAKIKAKSLDKGLMCYPMGGTIDGQRGDHILLAPPFIIEDNHVDEIVSKFISSVEEAL